MTSISPKLSEVISTIPLVHKDLQIGIQSEIKTQDDIKIKTLSLLNNEIKINGTQIGLHKNLSLSIIKDFKFTNSFSSSFKTASLTFSQCTTKENSSNSPSMMIHQLASLTFGIMLGKCKWEEPYGTYTPDLLCENFKEPICIDITGQNCSKKIKSVPNIPIIIIDKYSFLSVVNDDYISKMIEMSKMNEDINTEYIIDRVKQQTELPLLYDSKLLDYFSGKKIKDTIPIGEASVIAQQAVYDQFTESTNEMKVHVPSDQEINKMVLKTFIGLKELIKIKRENKYYIFPKFTDLEVLGSQDINGDEVKINSVNKSEMSVGDEEQKIKNKLVGFYLDIDEEPNAEQEREKKQELFEKVYGVHVVQGAFDSLRMYPMDKYEKRQELQRYYFQLADKFQSLDRVWVLIQEARILAKAKIALRGKGTSIPKVDYSFVPMNGFDMPYIDPLSYINSTSFPVDPDHERILQIRDMKDLSHKLSMSRDYLDMRFKARISVAISNMRKPESMFKVNHWLIVGAYAEVKIKGLLFEKDSGVAYVSYFYKGQLTRTEKWRLADVEAFSVAHHRCVCILVSMALSCKRKLLMPEISLIARLLNENSWSNGSFLKSLRYLSSGILMSSNKIDKSLKKCQEEFTKVSQSKLSSRLILDFFILNSSKGKIVKGKTPMFGLDFDSLGFECFLMNLGNQNTYGKMKHLTDTVNELANEIDMYDSNMINIKEIYSDFNRIIFGSFNKKEIYSEFRKHLDLIKQISGKMDDRFSFSPISVLTLYNEIISTKMTKKDLQGSVPALTSLMTAKGSSHILTGEPGMAIDTISELAESYKTLSTSEICLKALMRKGKLDLVMRLFDKDQLAANREISILTAEFRILQVVTESFFQRVAVCTGIDRLHDPKKVEHYTSAFEKHSENKSRALLTADQTRWGPNFNTLTFGLMSLVLSKLTTEAYIPALICFLSEFKLFEMPIWLPKILNRSNACLSLIGMTGRSHMGQGIFHQSSSLWHSYVFKFHQRINEKHAMSLVSNDSRLTYRIVTDTFITSDDVSCMASLEKVKFDKEDSKEIEDDLKIIQDWLISSYENIGSFLLLFGIKTSSYKNIVSKNMIEFNSIYLTDFKIGSTDIKYCYSLIDPATTGNFINDLYGIYDTYVSARNSLCTHGSACLISNLALIKLCRQWKIKCNLIPFQKEEDLIAGLRRIYNKPSNTENDSVYLLETKSNLHFHTRDLFDSDFKSINPFLNSIFKQSLDAMKGTRAREGYRSILTMSNDDKIMLRSSYYREFNSSGETYRSFLCNVIQDTNHIHYVLNQDYQTTFGVYSQEAKSNKGMFKIIKLRDNINIGSDAITVVVSHFPKEHYLTVDPDKCQLHLMRHKHKLHFINPLFPLSVSISEALSISTDALEDISISTTACQSIVTSGSLEPINYTKYVYIQPKNVLFFTRDVEIVGPRSWVQISNGTTYFSTPTQNIIEISTDETCRIRTFRPDIGVPIPKFETKSFHLDEYELEDLLSTKLDTFINHERRYWSSSAKDIYMNFQIDKKKMNIQISDVDKYSNISSVTHDPSLVKEISIADTIKEMMEFQISEDFYNQFDNEHIERDEDEKETEDEQAAANEVLRMLESKDEVKYGTISVKIRRRYGMFINRSWSLQMLIQNKYIIDLEQKGCILKKKGGKAGIINEDLFSNQSIKYYSTDTDFKKKIDFLSNGCRMSIEAAHRDLEFQEVKVKICDIANNKLVGKALIEMLLYKGPRISFSTVPHGTVLSVKGFIRNVNGC